MSFQNVKFELEVLKDQEAFQNVLKVAADRFASTSSRVLSDFFSKTFSPTSSSVQAVDLNSHEGFFVSILFTGPIYGEFMLAMPEEFVVGISGRTSEELSKYGRESVLSEYSDVFRELLNIIVGESVVDLGSFYDKLTITPPRVYRGRISYPKVHAGKAVISSDFGDITAYLYIDRMKLDIASSYREALASLEKANYELQEAMKLLKEQQNLLVQSEKMASLGTMAAGVAHEINTPLTTISLASGQIRELTEEEHNNSNSIIKFVDVIERTVSKIGTITSALNSFAKGGHGESYAIQPIFDIVQNAVVLCQSYSEERKTPVTCEPIPKEFSTQCHPTQIAHVIVSLIMNACDAIEDNAEKWVRVEVHQKDNNAEIYIIDSGKGIRPDIAKRIFDPFFTTKDVGKGRGLGLSSSQGIIRAHDGDLYLKQDHPNTCFVISMPLYTAAQKQTA